MHATRLTLAIVAALTIAVPAASDPLIVTTTTSASTLTNVLIGSGITVSGTPTLIGAATQQGTFAGGENILPFSSGIVLTSGSATGAPGPNSSDGLTGLPDPGTGANAQLSALAGQPTFDQNVLTFSFIPTENTISFQFVFASEEYHEFVDLFNDVFAFYLNGTNIAVVPDTSLPITINTINCVDNSGYYQANSASSPCFNPAQSVNTEYDGLAGGLFALPLFASGTVTPGEINTIQLAIADALDDQLDSAVFIAGGSFVSGPPTVPAPIPEPASLTLLGLGMAGAAARSARARMIRFTGWTRSFRPTDSSRSRR